MIKLPVFGFKFILLFEQKDFTSTNNNEGCHEYIQHFLRDLVVHFILINYFGKFTYVLFVAGVITVIYSEISFLLGKYFFPNFVSENVSKEIIYMFSFIVFINAGYFTFMLILDILKAETVI